MQPKTKPDLDKWLNVLNFFRFKHFHDQIDFSPKQILAVVKAIIELTDP